MKRNMDLLREILLRIENGKDLFDVKSHDDAKDVGAALPKDNNGYTELQHHLELLEQRGLIEVQAKSKGGPWYVKSLTWDGHDFLDSVRDNEIWAQTKAGAEKAGGFSLEILGALARVLIKKKIEQHMGVSVDI